MRNLFLNFFKNFENWLIIVLVLATIDSLQTIIGISIGRLAEANPAIVSAIERKNIYFPFSGGLFFLIYILFQKFFWNKINQIPLSSPWFHLNKTQYAFWTVPLVQLVVIGNNFFLLLS